MIETFEELRGFYPAPKERSLKKELDHLDVHCSRFVALSPFVIVATSGKDGRLDASPRGGEPGFVRIADPGTLLLGDASGNNRLDTLANIMETGQIGMLFFVPGVDETLRVNGRASLSRDEGILRHFESDRLPPIVVAVIAVESAFLHCAKALMRSRLWAPASQIARSQLPTMGQMIKEQTGSSGLPESQEAMLARYAREI